MLSDRRLRVVLVGSGWIAQKVHLPLIAAGGAPAILVGVCDAQAHVADAVAAQYGVPGCHTLENALAVDHDVTLVCTPPDDHAGTVEAALNSGRHVICEKPLTRDVDEAHRLIELAHSRGKRLLVCMTNRFRSDTRAMRRAISAGEVGDVRFVRAAWLRRAGVPATVGGRQAGVRWDLGSHLADLALWLTGWGAPSSSVSVEGSACLRGGDATARWQDAESPPNHHVGPDTAVVAFTADNEGCGVIEASWDVGVARDGVEILVAGSTGALRLATVFGFSPDRARMRGGALWVSQNTGTWEDCHVEHEVPYREYETQLLELLDELRRGEAAAQVDEALLGSIALLAGSAHGPGPAGWVASASSSPA